MRHYWHRVAAVQECDKKKRRYLVFTTRYRLFLSKSNVWYYYWRYIWCRNWTIFVVAITMFPIFVCRKKTDPLVGGDGCIDSIWENIILSALMTFVWLENCGLILPIWMSKHWIIWRSLLSKWRLLRAWQRHWKQLTKWHGSEPWTVSVIVQRRLSLPNWFTRKMYYENPRRILVWQYWADWVRYHYLQAIQRNALADYMERR